jgi:uncharacterized Zn finger protein (UPF0148 family)
MAQNFSCPSCGAPLDYAGNGSSTISCPYCYTSVIVPQELRAQRSQPVAPEVSMTLAGQAPKLRELSNLVRAKQRDQAIAVYQQVYGVSPQDAQRFVDQLMAASPVVLTSDMWDGVSTINVSTPMGNYTVNQYGSGMPNTMNYSVTPPMDVYANAANAANQATKRWMWYMGCFFVFFIFIAIVTTVPVLIGVLVPLWFAFK